ncbi:MAG: ABC transporter ATP-binding protein/permease [Vampirovibrio sp.]|nr:ABC transporter ATP-binding protein/permease [Vampirovibrio sp.]
MKLAAVRRDFTFLKRLIAYIKPYKTRFLIGMIASIPLSALEGAAAYMLGPFADSIIQHHEYEKLMWLPPAVLVAGLLQGVLYYISEYCTTYVGNRITLDIRTDLFQKLTSMEYLYFKRTPSGDIITRYFNDPVQIQTTIVLVLHSFLLNTLQIVFLTTVLLLNNWLYALVCLLVISMIVIPIDQLSKKIRRLDHHSRQITAQVLNLLNDTVLGIREIKSYRLKPYVDKQYGRGMQRYFHASMNITKAEFTLRPILSMIGAVALALILAFGGYQVQNGQMSIGSLLSFALALMLLYRPIKAVGQISGKFQRIMAACERVYEKLDETPAMDESDETKQSVDRIETVAFDHVSFEYESNQPVLKDINLTFSAGTVVALVGPSGGGKSTLVDLIPRFMDPTQGRVLINGIDAKQVSVQSLRQHIAIVSQKPMAFSGTIRENVLLGRLEATEEEVWQALKGACLDDWVRDLPDGLDTQVTEGGGSLSGGQQQRLAIARAFLKDAPLLILDEATSALDNESERKVQQALFNLVQGRTVFIIAHRLSSTHAADQILVVQNGQITESGTHPELMAQEGIYQRLYTLQFRDEPEFSRS